MGVLENQRFKSISAKAPLPPAPSFFTQVQDFDRGATVPGLPGPPPGGTLLHVQRLLRLVRRSLLGLQSPVLQRGLVSSSLRSCLGETQGRGLFGKCSSRVRSSLFRPLK